MLPLAERKAVAKTHPRVKFHAEPTPCTAMSSARLSSAVFHHRDSEVRKQKRDHARCRNTAHWKFTSLPRSWASDGDYCWSHLIHQGLMGDMAEEAAFQRWYEKKYGGQ